MSDDSSDERDEFLRVFLPLLEDFRISMAELNLRTSARTSLLRIAAEVNSEGYSPDQVEVAQKLLAVEAHFTRFTDNHVALVSTAEPEALSAHDDLYAEVYLYLYIL